MRARVGPFECSTSHRFSDFLTLQRRLQQAFPKRKFPPSALKLREQKLQLQPHRSTATVALARSRPRGQPPHQMPTRLLGADPWGREERPRRLGAEEGPRLRRSAACPKQADLAAFDHPRHRHTESRMRLLQRYCEDVCSLGDMASSSVMVAFFWPSEERGDGPVVAPDGSRATMLGGE